MTQPNPFSMANSLEHLVNPKIVVGATGYQVQVDIANVDTYYGRQLGGSSGLQIQQAYIQQIGTTGSSGSAFFSQIGSTASSGQGYFSQIGTSGSRGDAYFDDLYYNNLIPYPGSTGGTGTLLPGPGIEISAGVGGNQTISSLINAGQGISLNNPGDGQPYTITNTFSPTYFQGSTGINIVSNGGSTYTISSDILVVGGNSISVNRNNSTFTVNYTGSQGGGTTQPITGVSGSYAVFTASGLTSSTVLTSQNVVGPTGQLMLYSSQGPTYRNHLYTYDGGFPTLVTPYISSRYSNGIINVVPFSNQNYIQSSGTIASSFPLNISGSSGNPVLTTFDIPNGKVTINPDNLGGGVQVLGASTVSQSVYYGTSGATYNVYLYGGGGAGLSGFAGGAGGFVQVLGFVSGIGGVTFSFNNLTNPNGGNSLELLVNGITAAVAPGGGAGGTAGVGAAYGESGGSYNGQGFSAINNSGTGGTGGIFSNSQTNGTTGFNYKVGPLGVTAQSGIFNNVQVTYGLTGYLSPGTTITGYGVIPNVIGPTFATYYFPPGSTLIFQTDGVTFENSLYSFTGITYGLVDLSNINTSSLTGATFSRQASGGTATVSGSIYDFQGGYIGGTFSGDGSGIDQMLVGATFPVGLTGLTLTVNYGTSFLDYGITGGIQIDFSGGLTFSFSRSLGSVIAPSLRITDPIGISPDSIIQVQTQTAVSNGNNGDITAGGAYGGGGGFYGGGGGTGGAGGGAGAAFINTLSGFTGSFGTGSGSTPYHGSYNANAAYGYGGSNSTGGTPYYVVEKIAPGVQPDVLQVNGNESVSGKLNVQNNVVVNGTGNVLTTNGSILSSGAVQAPDFTGINPGLSAVQAANFSQGISYTDTTLTIANSIRSYPPVGSIMMYCAAVSPVGWLVCNGSPVPVQYTQLIALIGANLPDLRSRFPIGFGQGAGLSNYPTMFASGGSENSTLPAHTHTINDPTHAHGGILSQGGGFAAADGGNGNRANGGGTSSGASTGITINSEGVSAVGTNVPPYLVVNYIIKT
jgi:microcystin-dependent protein